MKHLLVTAAAAVYMHKLSNNSISTKSGMMVRPRRRKSLHEIYMEVGPNMFRRAFSMSFPTFLSFYKAIKDDLFIILRHNPKSRRGPNGRIHPTIIVACILRLFARGDPLDIVLAFGVSKTVVHNSVDVVILAVCRCKTHQLQFPSSHEDR